MKNCPLHKLPVAELESYVTLVRFIAKRMQKRLPASVEFDDLFSAGLIGLTQALEKYDANKGTRFKSFAEFRIRGAMLDELRSQDWAPKGIRQRVKQYNQVREKILLQTGHQATDQELRENLKLNKLSYDRLVEAVKTLDQMNASAYQDNNCEGPNQLENICSHEPSADSLCVQHDIRNYFVKAMLNLDEKHQKVLMLYYFEDMNLREIGKEMDISESRASQLHSEGIKALKLALVHDKTDNAKKDMLSSAA
jgi:RNA polymerase sigma factor FliA